MRLQIVVLLCAVTASSSVFAQDRSIVPAYKTDTSPTIDGVISPGEWDAAGPPIVVAPGLPNVGIDEGTLGAYGGAEDASFQFRVMWEEPWNVHFLFEVTDDEAMDEDPRNLWERDQLELFIDGDHQNGNGCVPTADGNDAELCPEELASFQWWDGDEIFGKFGASRPNPDEVTFEGNTGIMTQFEDDIFIEEDPDATFINALVASEETGEAANFNVEYTISLEPMFWAETFEDDPAGTQGKLVENETFVKFTASFADNDNEDDDATQRSHVIDYYRELEGFAVNWRNSMAFANLTFFGEYVGGVAGDFDGSGQRDAADLDLLADAMANGDAAFDLNADGAVDFADREFWISDLSNSFIGDSNLDGEFNSSDFVAVFQAGLFESGEEASWATGDWNGDKLFDTSDFVAAFQSGGFEQGMKDGGIAVVPEPSSLILVLLSMGYFVGRRRQS